MCEPGQGFFVADNMFHANFAGNFDRPIGTAIIDDENLNTVNAGDFSWNVLYGLR